MKDILNKLKRFGNQVLGLFPSALPNGVEAFDQWVDSIISTYPLPTEDRTSIEFALSSMIINFGQRTAYKSKYTFYLMLKAAAAKQVAGERFYQIKSSQMAAQQAAAKAQHEATQPVASSGPTQ